MAGLLREIDRSGESGERRALLRFIALVHDSFKNKVIRLLPRTGENHHAMRARRFAERFTDDERLLATIELHDRPYAIWRKMRRRGGRVDRAALEELLARVPDHQLFLRFIETEFPWATARYRELYPRPGSAPRDYREAVERRVEALARGAGFQARSRDERVRDEGPPRSRQLSLVW